MSHVDSPQPHAFKLGFLTHVHGAGRPASAVYRDLVEVFVAAEELGFDGGWVAQHHLRGEYGRLPSPLVLFAAVAERTTRLELGTAVTVLPLEDPIRLAEDAAVFDALSGGGRLQLGLGSGGANLDAFAAFGLSEADLHARFDGALDTLRRALRGDELTGGVRLQPPPGDLADRLWQATSSVERAAAAARAGDGLLLGTAVHDPRLQQLPLAEAYLAARPDRPRIAVTRAVFPATSRQAAADDLAPALDVHRRAFLRHGYTGLLDLSVEQYLARINVHYGTVDEVVAGLLADPALFQFADWFLPVVQHEASSVGDDIRRLEVIATEIAPRLGWTPAREPVPA